MEDRLKFSLCLGGALFCIALAGAAVHVFSGRWEDHGPTTLAGPALTMNLNDPSSSRPARRTLDGKRFAYITGAVVNPGMYAISDEARVVDLVRLAGGLRHDAQTEQLNLAAPVRDGSHVQVKAVVFEQNQTRKRKSTSVNTSAVNKAASGNVRYVYVNTASAEEMCVLPGVGPALAQRIVEYRQNHGSFSSADSLLAVPGIGRAKLNKFRSLLRF